MTVQFWSFSQITFGEIASFHFQNKWRINLCKNHHQIFTEKNRTSLATEIFFQNFIIFSRTGVLSILYVATDLKHPVPSFSRIISFCPTLLSFSGVNVTQCCPWYPLFYSALNLFVFLIHSTTFLFENNFLLIYSTVIFRSECDSMLSLKPIVRPRP